MRKARSLATLLLLPFLAECHDQSITAPGVPESARAIAIRVHVDVAAGTVATVPDAPAQTASFNLMTPGGPPAPSFSLLGSDGVALQSSNVQLSLLGTNKLLVRFDLALTNTLKNVTLIKPTVPTPPAGVTGLVLFPFQAKPAGGSSGGVTMSADWDGAPYNFFNDTKCTGSPSRDCFRWEQYPAPLAPGATAAPRTVGFEIDKTVQSFDVVMLLAADLQNVPDAPPVIGLSDAAAQFQTATGSAPVSILVANAGGGALSNLSATVTYAAGQPAGWLSAALSSTTAPTLLTLSPMPSPLNNGTYNATVAIASPGVSNSPQMVSVTYVVTNANIPSTNAIYVSQSDATAADDATCGLGPTGSGAGAHPCASINRGLARASTTGRSEVRVADGRYTEAVALVNGKNLLGGYQPDTWQRHVSTTNTIIDGVSSDSGHDRTVIAIGITSPTVFEGFVVRGSANNKSSGNSYAIYVAGSGQLAIQRNVIYAGSGGPGSNGSAGPAGIRFADGTGREGNPAGYDAFITGGSGQCAPTNSRSYINGGFSVGSDNISGGNGGGISCPTSASLVQMSAHDGTAGQSGSGPGGGAGGLAGVGGLDFRLESLGTVCVAATSGVQTGTNGGAGADGQPGAGVTGATAATGSVAGGHWVGSAGSTGLAGFNGGGGGGGGAGGGAFSESTTENKDRLGGIGGGGGAGGTGGGGGGAGGAGGGAFAIFIIGAAPAISDNVIVRGAGGNAGNGGTGGVGAAGGEGGTGGLASVFCTGAGGHGGKGGSGGAGSGGGGGAGGASYGIFTYQAGTPDYCTSGKNTISGGVAGAGGAGGSSVANPGGSGNVGVLGACAFN